MADENVITTVIDELRTRSRRSRQIAWILVGLIIGTVFSLVLFFFGAISYISYSPFGVSNIREVEELKAAQEKESDEIKKMRLELELRKAQLEQENARNSGLIFTISSAVARIGAVLIALYLVQILLSLTRYHLRLADHLEACAHGLRFCPEDPLKITALVPVLSAAHVDFGKAPSTPIEKVLDVVKEVLSRQKVS